MNKPNANTYYDLWDVVRYINEKYKFTFNGCNGGKESDEQRAFMDYIDDRPDFHNGSLISLNSSLLSEKNYHMPEKARLFIKCILDDFGTSMYEKFPDIKQVKIHYWW